VAPTGPRFGVLSDGERFEPWQRRCLELLLREADGAPCAWIVLPPGLPTGGPVLRALAGRARRGLGSAPDELRALGEEARFRPAGVGAPLTDGDAARLRACGAEFVLHLGDGAPPAGIEACARRGLWRFEHGGDPPGFHEALRGDAVTEAELVGRRAGDGPRRVLARGALRTVRGSCRRNRAAILGECARWPARVCRGGLADEPPGEPAAEPRGARGASPGDLAWLAHALSGWTRTLGAAARRLVLVDQWNVGVVDAPIGSFLGGAPPEVRWFPTAGTGRLSADPFGLEVDGRAWVLYERLDFAEGRGYLVARPLDGTTPGPETTALRLPFHLSYPWILRHRGEVYCVPESWEANEVALYRATRFPEAWEKAATLIPGFAGIDSTLIEVDGRWWCFATDRAGAHDRELLLFHAPDLLGPWEPHRRNPVKVDVRSARCAGTPFRHEGRLYRPAQDYSRKLEGRITLNRVVELSTERFVEETVATIDPFAGPWPHKVHTLCALGDRTLVDGCREVPAFRTPGLLGFKLRRAWSRLRANGV